MSIKTKGLVVEALFELSEMNIKEFMREELTYLGFYRVEASCEFEKRLIQKASCMCKQYLDLLSSPHNLLNEKDLEDILRSVYEINDKLEKFRRITLLN